MQHLEDLTEQITLRLSKSDATRVENLVSRYAELRVRRAGVVRRALLIGLQALEADPSEAL